ncbi:MAG: YdcF family protein [Gemmatimonadaceae bacterium]|nr:YdcF family protein [Chitinophagaceae bacterium]
MIKIFSLYIALLSIVAGAGSCAFTPKTTRTMLAKAEGQQFDMIIVPGIPFDNGKWDRTMKARVYWSKYLFDKGIAKNIMYSGSAVYTPYFEASVMALYAEALGIPKENIFTETKAEHSSENIYYGFHKARQLGYKRIAVATDPFQAKLMKKFARKKVSSDITIIPIVFDTLKAMEAAMIDPPINAASAFQENFVSIKKREGFWKRFRGTMGAWIDTSAYR